MTLDSHASVLDAQRVLAVRRRTLALTAPLEPEDCVVQSMEDVSPTRWHLAHTSWFFEAFVLRRAVPGYRPFHAAFEGLFNSYYQTVGNPFPRARRGLLSRPTVAEVLAYREHVDDALEALIADGIDDETATIIELGLQHEQQHQELILTDIQHVLAQNPLRPVYRDVAAPRHPAPPLTWRRFPGGRTRIGHAGDDFAFDNERPSHDHLLVPFELASRPVTNAEYLAFMEAGGYEDPLLWLSDGWTAIRESGWQAPLYWERRPDGWWRFTLAGMQRVEPSDPVVHLSLYEADAYARWARARLPTEAEWEVASRSVEVRGNFSEADVFRPHATGIDDPLVQMFGDVWEWTSSPYSPYPGYRAPAGALGEYNGKFMCNQMVLRGGSCATPANHIRATYRNFFPPSARWQFTGLRLAR